MVRKVLCLFGFVLGFGSVGVAAQAGSVAAQAGAAAAQTASAPAPPASAAAQARPATGPAANQPATTLHATTDLVVVDVVATDDKENPIHHLTAPDFTVLEDGKPQTLKVFEEHVAGTPAPLPPLPKFEPGTFTNYTPTPATGALNILLFDKLNTPINAQTVVRDQVLKYLKEAQPGTRMAIFSLTTELKLLQGFTSNPELLRALVEGKKGSQGASPLMNNVMNGDSPLDDDPAMDMATEMLGNDPTAAEILADMQQFEAQTQAFQIQLRQQYTLDALNQLARYMSMLPGRKNLIWFSGSFPISILPDPDLQNPFAVVSSAEDEFRETVELLSRSQVSVYPIDARGLTVPTLIDASQTGSTANKNPGNFANAQMKALRQTGDEQSTMRQMAEATGGRAFVNTNGLKEAIAKAVEAGSNYYTLAYTPSNVNWNGNFRKIQVKLDKKDVTLAYRRGYFADDPNKPVHRGGQQNPPAGAVRYNAMHAAMVRGGPDPTELIFVANVRPSTGETETAPAPGNQPGKKLNGPFERYTVRFLANPRQIQCPAGADGTHHCVMEFLTFVYDHDGTLVNMQTNGVSATIPEATFAGAMGHNFSYLQQISVPAKGDYVLRIGMRDATTDNVGAIELPVKAVAKLAPLAASNAEGTTGPATTASAGAKTAPAGTGAAVSGATAATPQK